MDFVFESRIANYIAAAQVLFEHKGLLKYANVLRYGKYQLKTKTGYDNWNGGQYAHTLLLTVPMNVFECIADDLSACEQAIMGMKRGNFIADGDVNVLMDGMTLYMIAANRLKNDMCRQVWRWILNQHRLKKNGEL